MVVHQEFTITATEGNVEEGFGPGRFSRETQMRIVLIVQYKYDNDGIPDIVEAGGTDSGDGMVDGTFADTDGDGWSNVFDSDNGGTANDQTRWCWVERQS